MNTPPMLIAGTGKLASELLAGLDRQARAWGDRVTGELGIAPADLARHAVHRIEIGDGDCRLRLESLVTGDAPYVDGVRRIVQAVLAQPLEPRCYDVLEFIERGWL